MKILIGIQARSTSRRLKGKSSMEFGDASVVGTVMLQAIRVAEWFQGSGHDVSVVMLVPFDDPLKKQFEKRYTIFEGPEDDVLLRYYQACKEYDADYVVRLTGDCVWHSSHVISKCLRAALKHDADYCSNVLVRTFMEGLDVEVIKTSWVYKLHENEVSELDAFDREHVTTRILDNIRLGQSGEKKIRTVFAEYDLSNIKTSIDTREEYIASTEKFRALSQKKKEALSYGGISS